MDKEKLYFYRRSGGRPKEAKYYQYRTGMAGFCEKQVKGVAIFHGTIRDFIEYNTKRKVARRVGRNKI